MSIPISLLVAGAQLNRDKYHGMDKNNPLITFLKGAEGEYFSIYYYVEKLDANGQPVANSKVTFKGAVRKCG